MASPFLLLPAELRLRVYDMLPELQSGSTEIVSHHTPLTPPICRTNRLLREEAMPLYVQNTHFSIRADQDARPIIQSWSRALGSSGLKNLRGLQMSRNWQSSQPTRFQCHVGFYVRLEKNEEGWLCSTGTYPIARDMRGMRLESVELLQHTVRQNLIQAMLGQRKDALSAANLYFLADAMDIVATHPISTFLRDQVEEGVRSRGEIWSEMERELSALNTEYVPPATHTPSFLYSLLKSLKRV